MQWRLMLYARRSYVWLLGLYAGRPVNSENTEVRYMHDRPAYNHLGYMQDSNLTNRNPLTVTLVRNLIRTNQTYHPRKSPLCFKKIDNLCWSAIDVRKLYKQII